MPAKEIEVERIAPCDLCEMFHEDGAKCVVYPILEPYRAFIRECDLEFDDTEFML